MAEAASGSWNVNASISQVMSTSSGSRVLLDGTMATSSNPYARLAAFPIPISVSMWGPPSSANTRKRPPGGRAGAACQPCSTLSGSTGLGKAASADQGLGLSVGDGDADAAGVSEGAGDGFAVSVELGLGSVLTVGLGEGSVGP